MQILMLMFLYQWIAWVMLKSETTLLRLRVMRLLFETNLSGVIVILAYNFSFHFMVIISDECKCEGLVKTTFKSCGKPMFFEIYHTRN